MSSTLLIDSVKFESDNLITVCSSQQNHRLAFCRAIAHITDTLGIQTSFTNQCPRAYLRMPFLERGVACAEYLLPT